MEAKFPHDPFQAWPLNSVKSLTHVEFDGHETILPLPPLVDMMHCFKRHQYVVCDQPVKEKITLGGANDIRQNLF